MSVPLRSIAFSSVRKSFACFALYSIAFQGVLPLVQAQWSRKCSTGKRLCRIREGRKLQKTRWRIGSKAALAC